MIASVALHRRPALYLFVITVLVVLLWWSGTWPGYFNATYGPYGPGNSTLGFGGIYVPTDDKHSWRVQGLKQAAKHVGIEVTLPETPRHSEQDAADFMNGADFGDQANLGTVRLTMNLIALLDVLLRSGAETGLFLEDDVDFSIHIKEQMTTLSHAMQQHTDQTNSHQTNVQHPYGSDWTILWLGHCGLHLLPNVETTPYRDPRALPWPNLFSGFNNYYKDRPANETQQILSHVAPLCTFAWAVTRPRAQQMLDELRDQRIQVIDLEMHRWCFRDDETCVAPAPELFHHQKVPAERKGAAVGDVAWWREQHKYTYNVEWSARCNAAQSGERTGEHWRCAPSVYDRAF